MSLELPKRLFHDEKVCKCPHCGRLVIVNRDVLDDPVYFTKEGAYSGVTYRLPPLIWQSISGTGMLVGGATFGYYNFGRSAQWAERIVPPKWPSRPIFMPLVAFPPLVLGTAIVAGITGAVLPAFVELTMEAFLGPSQAITGAMTDLKKYRMPREKGQ